MKCVGKGWMTILSGPAASGKTSLVRLLANLTGNRLRQFSMNSSIDTTELLGGFEQIDLQRYKRQILANLTGMMNKVSELLLTDITSASSLRTLQAIHSIWSLLTTKTHLTERSSDNGPTTGAGHSADQVFDHQQYSLIDQLLEKVDSLAHERSWDWTSMCAGIKPPRDIYSAVQR